MRSGLLFAAILAASGCAAPPIEFRPGHGFLVEPVPSATTPAPRIRVEGRQVILGHSRFCAGPGSALLGAALTPDGEPIVLSAGGLHLGMDLGTCADGSCRAHRLQAIASLEGARAFLVVQGRSLGKGYRGDVLTLHADRIDRHVLAREGAGFRAESEEFLRWEGGAVLAMREDPVHGLQLETASGVRRVRHRGWTAGTADPQEPDPDLNDRDADRRLAAVRALAFRPDPGSVPALLGMIRGDVPWVCREAALALARVGTPEASAPSVLRLREGVDPVLEAALIRVLERCGTPEGLLSDPSAIVRRCALSALGGKVPLETVVGLLDPAQAALTAEARREIVRRGALAQALDLAAATRREEVWSALPELGPRIPGLLDREPAFALSVLARWEPATWEADWRRRVEDLIDPSRPDLARKAVAALRGGNPLRLRAIRGPIDLRIEALAALAPGFIPDAAEMGALLEALGPEAPAFRRLAACRALGQAKLDDAQRAALAPLLARMNAMELDRILTAWRGRGDEVLGRVLASNPATERLPAPLLRGLWAAPEPAAAGLMERAAREEAERRARLEELGTEVLDGGDARKGRDVLFGPKAECTACHTLRGQGARVGPELTRIGSQRTRRELLESIAFPSAAFAPGYESYRIRVRDGEVYDGFLQRESPEEVVLVQGDRTERRIPKYKVEAIERGAVSVMPQGFGERLRPEELRDLLAFLSSLR